MKPQFLILACLTTLSACGSTTHAITAPATGQTVAASASDAVLLVGNIGRLAPVNLLDEKGQVVGQLTGRSYTVVHHAPGAFKLYMVVDDKRSWGDRVEGQLEAGKVYYVQIFAKMELVAQRLDAKDWAERKDNEKNLDPVGMTASGVPQLTQELGDIPGIIKDVDAKVDNMDADEKAKRTVQAGDGEAR
jgi:hypothetical protein